MLAVDVAELTERMPLSLCEPGVFLSQQESEGTSEEPVCNGMIVPGEGYCLRTAQAAFVRLLCGHFTEALPEKSTLVPWVGP